MIDAPLTDDEFAAALRALAHPVRLRILRLVATASGPCCCIDVTQGIDLAQSTVSQHLKVLLDAGLIERHPMGTRNRYSLRAERMAAISAASAALGDGLCACVGGATSPKSAKEAIS